MHPLETHLLDGLVVQHVVRFRLVGQILYASWFQAKVFSIIFIQQVPMIQPEVCRHFPWGVYEVSVAVDPPAPFLSSALPRVALSWPLSLPFRKTTGDPEGDTTKEGVTESSAHIWEWTPNLLFTLALFPRTKTIGSLGAIIGQVALVTADAQSTSSPFDLKATEDIFTVFFSFTVWSTAEEAATLPPTLTNGRCANEDEEGENF